jgi:hypothetical protein
LRSMTEVARPRNNGAGSPLGERARI